jgi:predicted HAD superfamily Cof-like phosphohydrolase
MRDVNEFHEVFTPNQHKDLLKDRTTRRVNLIQEEYREVMEALQEVKEEFYRLSDINRFKKAREHLAKELADLLYVVYGTADEFNIPLEEVFVKVHESNMTKVWDDGTVHRNATGKVLKPPTYTPPNLDFIHDDRI